MDYYDFLHVYSGEVQFSIYALIFHIGEIRSPLKVARKSIGGDTWIFAENFVIAELFR